MIDLLTFLQMVTLRQNNENILLEDKLKNGNIIYTSAFRAIDALYDIYSGKKVLNADMVSEDNDTYIVLKIFLIDDAICAIIRQAQDYMYKDDLASIGQLADRVYSLLKYCTENDSKERYIDRESFVGLLKEIFINLKTFYEDNKNNPAGRYMDTELIYRSTRLIPPRYYKFVYNLYKDAPEWNGWVALRKEKYEKRANY